MRGVFLVGFLMIAACSGSPDQPRQPTEEVEEIDDFQLSISAGRWAVMIENARSALRAMDDTGIRSDSASHNAHYSLKYAATELLNLRNEVCLMELVPAETCEAFELPQWVYVYEPTPPPAFELVRRSEWLGEALAPYEAAACAEARESDRWINICSVE